MHVNIINIILKRILYEYFYHLILLKNRLFIFFLNKNIKTLSQKVRYLVYLY